MGLARVVVAVSRLGRDYQYRKVRERVLRGAQVCHIYGEPLDWDAPPRSRWAPTVDHVVPVSSLRDMDPRAARRIAIDPSLMRPAHYGCNASRGANRSKPKHVSREWASV